MKMEKLKILTCSNIHPLKNNDILRTSISTNVINLEIKFKIVLNIKTILHYYTIKQAINMC